MGFRELIVALSKAPHESLFSTELVTILVEHFFKHYYHRILYRCLVPFIVYFFLVLFYLSHFAVNGVDENNESEKRIEQAMRLLIFFLLTYFIFFEIVCMMRDGLDYITDVFNWIDIISFMINLYLIVVTVFIDVEK